MYTNVKQHCNCQSQDNFSTLNITLSEKRCTFSLAPYIKRSLETLLSQYNQSVCGHPVCNGNSAVLGQAVDLNSNCLSFCGVSLTV